MPSLTSGTASSEPPRFPRPRLAAATRRRVAPVVDEQRLGARDQPAEQSGVDGLDAARACRTCWRSCTRMSSRRRSRSTSTRCISSKRNSVRVSARMRSARSSTRRAPCSSRPASNRRVSGPRSASTESRCVPMLLKLSTNSSIRPDEQPEHRRAAGVVEHGREHAGRDEDQIGERITRRDDAPHVAAVEAEEQHHQRRR